MFFQEKNTNQVIELKNMELVKIEEEETIFKKLNKYYVGNKEKKEIDLSLIHIFYCCQKKY